MESNVIIQTSFKKCFPRDTSDIFKNKISNFFNINNFKLSNFSSTTMSVCFKITFSHTINQIFSLLTDLYCNIVTFLFHFTLPTPCSWEITHMYIHAHTQLVTKLSWVLVCSCVPPVVSNFRHLFLFNRILDSTFNAFCWLLIWLNFFFFYST